MKTFYFAYRWICLLGLLLLAGEGWGQTYNNPQSFGNNKTIADNPIFNASVSFGNNANITGNPIFNGAVSFNNNTDIEGDAIFKGVPSFGNNSEIIGDITFEISSADAQNLCNLLNSLKNNNALKPGSSVNIIVTGTITNSATQSCLLAYDKDKSLPTPLTRFQASRQAAGVLLYWKTDRQEPYAVQVERSEDGYTFVPLSIAEYADSYLDAQAPTTTLWYRLRIADRQGYYLYSPLVQVGAAAHSGLQVVVSPNPTQNGKLQAYIRSEKAYSQVQLRLTDLGGRLLAQETLRLDAQGQGQWSSVLQGNSGMLLLQITDGQETQTEKVLLQ